MDALDKAFESAEVSYHLAAKAVRDPGSMLAPALGSYGALGAQPGSQMNATQQYAHLKGWVFAAVRAIAQRLASADIFIGRVKNQPRRRKSIGDRAEPLDTHPLLDLLDNPNHLQSRWHLVFCMVADLLCTGRSFLWSPIEKKGQRQLWPVPTSWVRPLNVFANEWQIMPRGGQATFDPAPDEIVHLNLPDPSNPVAGALSPLQAEAEAVSADEAIQVAQYRAFANGLFPSVLVRAGRLPSMTGTGDGPRVALTDEQRAELIDAIRKVCGGAYNYGNPLILDSLIESIEKLSLTPAEMDFLNSSLSTKARILQGFGVSPFSIGEVEGGNRASCLVAEKTLCKNILNPLGEMLSLSLTKHLVPMFSEAGEKLVLWFAPFQAEDDEMDLKLWELALRFACADRNEYRVRMMNLPEESQYRGPPEVISSLLRNSIAGQQEAQAKSYERLGIDELGTRPRRPIDSWEWDRGGADPALAGDGNGRAAGAV